jgi:cytoskeletal protein CcmA (bactofilin family)
MFDKRKEPETHDEPETSTWQEPPRPEPITRTQATSVIGSSITVKGDVTGDENLIIEGHVDGVVQLPANDLTVGASGSVTANLEAKTIRIDGKVDGNIEGTELVTVSRTGKVKGDITAPRVTLEDGAQFKGSIDMDPGSRPALSAAKSVPKDASDDKGTEPAKAIA